MSQQISELWQRIKPFAMQDLISILSLKKQIQSSEDMTKILLYSITANKIRSYTANEDGFLGAIGAADDDDTILIPPVTITLTQALTISKKIAIVGEGSDMWNSTNSHKTKIINSGDVGTTFITISGSSGKCMLANLELRYSTSSSSSRGTLLAGSTQNTLYNCFVYCNNNGTATSVKAQYSIFIDHCYLIGYSIASNGYGFEYGAPGTAIYAYHSEFRGEGAIGGTGAVVLDEGELYNCRFRGSKIGLHITTPGGG